VTGLDLSARIIGLGAQMVEQGLLRYALADEGELVFYRERKLADFGLEAMRSKVEFWQADPCNLKPLFTGYDLILANDLLDRLYSPTRFLAQIHERLNPGGLLVIASAYAWNPSITPRAEWLGGFKQAGESFTSLDGIKNLLSPQFHLLQAPVHLPQLIWETRRKFHYRLLETTAWVKSA
jgi:putative 4-mercaptohistidine N1-methyltranferase